MDDVEIVSHVDQHTSGDPKCPICETVFDSNARLEHHISTAYFANYHDHQSLRMRLDQSRLSTSHWPLLQKLHFINETRMRTASGTDFVQLGMSNIFEGSRRDQMDLERQTPHFDFPHVQVPDHVHVCHHEELTCASLVDVDLSSFNIQLSRTGVCLQPSVPQVWHQATTEIPDSFTMVQMNEQQPAKRNYKRRRSYLSASQEEEEYVTFEQFQVRCN